MKTLVAFVTKGGVAGEYAAMIAGILKKKGFDVDLIDLKKQKPDVKQYDTVIVGSGIRMQRIYGELFDFLDKNDLSNKTVAIFFSSNESGNPKSYGGFVRKYVKTTLEKYPKIKIIAIEGFGGRMRFFGKTVSDNRDPDKAKAWADELARKLKS